jgi:hypothetical protein
MAQTSDIASNGMLMRGIQIGGMSKLGWLIGLIKHAI